jgi:hypothetical protein
LDFSCRRARLALQLFLARFTLHVIKQADIGEHPRGAHQVRGLRFVKPASRVRPTRDLDNPALGLLIEMIVPGVRVGLQISSKLFQERVSAEVVRFAFCTYR